MNIKIDEINEALSQYLKSLKLTFRELNDLINIEKINKNIKDELLNFNKLNFILSNNEEETCKKIKILFSKDPKCFLSLLTLLATKDKSTKIFDNEKVYSIDYFLNSAENIIYLLKKTNFINLIINNKIKNFADFALGVEVGLDTNARKNRGGSKFEKIIEHEIEKIFKEQNNIIIEKQKTIKFINYNYNKKFDFVISNTLTNKKILIESSFYNSRGSKINETAKSYMEINKIIKEYQDLNFIWIADGYGMTTIKNTLKTLLKNDLKIMNFEQFVSYIRSI